MDFPEWELHQRKEADGGNVEQGKNQFPERENGRELSEASAEGKEGEKGK